MIINLQALLDTNPDYTLAIMYEDSLFNVTRYILWQGVNALPLPVPSAPYNGQVILKNFRLEIWNTSVGSVTQTVPLTLVTSVLGNIDYRWGTDFQLAGNNGDIVSFQSIYVASTAPPRNNNSTFWWVMADRTANDMSIPLPSRILSTDLLSKVSGTFSSTSSQYLEFRTGRVLSCNNLNGGILGYDPGDIWIVFAKNANAGYSNGDIISMDGVNCQTANTNATDITVNGWAGTLNTGNTGPLIFYVLRIAQGDAWIYNLIDWTIVSHITGVPAVGPATLITVGGTSAFYLMEIIGYETVQPQPIADLINKYISDTYSSGMMPLPLTFPDTKPINT